MSSFLPSPASMRQFTLSFHCLSTPTSDSFIFLHSFTYSTYPFTSFTFSLIHLPSPPCFHLIFFILPHLHPPFLLSSFLNLFSTSSFYFLSLCLPAHTFSCFPLPSFVLYFLPSFIFYLRSLLPYSLSCLLFLHLCFPSTSRYFSLRLFLRSFPSSLFPFFTPL